MVYLPHWPVPQKRPFNINESDSELIKIKTILQRLNNPQNNLPPVIHIAGTNGKGSTTAMLASIFQAANYKTHIYTSPHLHNCNERIVIANKQIDDHYFYEITNIYIMVVTPARFAAIN
jgi:dihydrofolate synthase/folylpolyglutamate synthase